MSGSKAPSLFVVAVLVAALAAAADAAPPSQSRRLSQAFLPPDAAPAAVSPTFLPGGSAAPPPPPAATPGIYLPFTQSTPASPPAPAAAAATPTPAAASPAPTPAPAATPTPAPTPASLATPAPTPAAAATPAPTTAPAAATPPAASRTGPPIVAIVVPVVVGGCLIAAVVAGLLIIHRRRRRQRKQDQQHAKHPAGPDAYERFTAAPGGGNLGGSSSSNPAYPALGNSFSMWAQQQEQQQQQGSGDSQEARLISPAGTGQNHAAASYPGVGFVRGGSCSGQAAAAADMPRCHSATAAAAAEEEDRRSAAVAALWMAPLAPAAAATGAPKAAAPPPGCSSRAAALPPTSSRQHSQQQSFASPFARRITGLMPALESADYGLGPMSGSGAALPPGAAAAGPAMARTATPTPPATPVQTLGKGSSRLSWVVPGAGAAAATAGTSATADSQMSGLSGLSGLTGMSGLSASSAAAGVPVFASVAARPSRVLSGPPMEAGWDFDRARHKLVRVLMQVEEDPGAAQPVTLLLLVSAPPPKPELAAQVVLASDPILADVDLAIDYEKELALPSNSFIGAGAFGQVHRTLYKGRLPVAVKMLMNAELQQADPETLRCFREELTIMARLEHPHIVRCYGGNLDCQHPFIVTELCECSLDRVIAHFKRAQGGGLPLRMTLTVGLHIASALWHMHPSVVHRDLKPQNVLLDAAGTAKVTDFGLSRMKTHTFVSTRHVEAGTASYMAPECFIGDGVTEKVDVYGLGMLLWECVMGERPWRHHNMMQVAFQVAMSNNRPPLPPISASCPAELGQLISECWASNPKERPSSGEVMKALAQMIRMAGP